MRIPLEVKTESKSSKFLIRQIPHLRFKLIQSTSLTYPSLEKGIRLLKRAADCTTSQNRWDKMRRLRDIDLAQGVKYNATYSMNEIDVAIEAHRQILQLLSDEDEDVDKMTARADFSFALKARLRHRDIELPSGVQGSTEDLRAADKMAKKESSLALMISNTITVSETNFINQTCL